MYKSYCFDLDGTVYKGATAIASAITYIQSLESRGIKPFYVTNNASKTMDELYEALTAIGLHPEHSHIYSSARATAIYVATHYPQQSVHLIGSAGLRNALIAEGVTMSSDGQVLVTGLNREVTYNDLSEAALAVQNGATFIATNPDVKFPTELGFVPGNGAIATLIASVSGVEPTYIGKPSPIMLELIAREHNLKKSEMVLIGDNVNTDIACGVNFGIDTIHVNTGVTSTSDAKAHPVRATRYVDTLLALL